MRTNLYHFRYDLEKTEEHEAWIDLKERMREAKVRMSTHDYKFRHVYAMAGKPVEVQTEYIFEDQWNATISGVNFRLMEFSLEDVLNKNIKVGYYIDVTDEMRQEREDRLSCGFCGKQYLKSTGKSLDGVEFTSFDDLRICRSCCGSPHLSRDNFDLLRVEPIGCKKREPVGDMASSFIAETARLQYRRGLATTVLSRQELASEAKKALDKLAVLHWMEVNNIKHDFAHFDGKMWKMGFVWKVPDHIVHMLHKLLEDFPAQYCIVCHNERIVNDARDYYTNTNGELVQIVV